MTTVSSRRDPFGEFDALVRQAFGQRAFSSGFSPAAEVTRDGEDAVVRVELPGVDVENDVTVEVADRRLVIRGERRDERSGDRPGNAVTEIRYGEFRRSFGLPTSVSADAIGASYDAGVPTVRVSGAYAGARPRRIAISSGGETAIGGETV